MELERWRSSASPVVYCNFLCKSFPILLILGFLSVKRQPAVRLYHHQRNIKSKRRDCRVALYSVKSSGPKLFNSFVHFCLHWFSTVAVCSRSPVARPARKSSAVLRKRQSGSRTVPKTQAQSTSATAEWVYYHHQQWNLCLSLIHLDF